MMSSAPNAAPNSGRVRAVRRPIRPRQPIKATGSSSRTGVATATAADDDAGVNWGQAVIALVIAFVPAFGVYMSVSVAANTVLPAALVLSLPVFGYLLYQRPHAKAMVGGACFWLAVEALLTPLALLVYTITFASQETTTSAGQTGAAIGGFILIVGAFVVGFPIAAILYLISRRLDADSEETTDDAAGAAAS